MTAEGVGYAQTAVIDRRHNALSQLTLGSAGRFRAAIAAREFLHPAGGIDELLFAGEKRMAGGADADFDVPASRAGMVDRAAGAANVRLVVVRMNVRFHVGKRVRTVAAESAGRKW